MPITPESLSQANTEHAHQVALFAWAALTAPQYPELQLMFAIPNGGKRDKITASNLKAEGVKAGTPDIFLPVARGGFHGLFIELKRLGDAKHKKGRASDDQKQTIIDLHAQGFGAMVCVGWEHARNMLLQYLNS